MKSVASGGGRQAADHRPAQGAFCWPDSPRAKAMGNMPAIMAQVVIRIGRKPAGRALDGRRRRPARPAAAGFSANVTSRMALAIATPTAMIAPMNDWMFSVVRVR